MNNIEATMSLDNPLVTIVKDEDDGDLSLGDISLREAILYSNDGDTIGFDASLKNAAIPLTLGGIRIDKSLTIQGFEDSQLTIDGNNNSRVFNISDRSSRTLDVTLNHLTIIGGNAGEQKGGGIRNLENLTINNSTVTDNSARHGGGIYNASTDKYDSTIKINNSVISDNSAEGNGGGINLDSNSQSYNDPDTLILNESIVSGNKAGYNGGGIASSLSSINISNSLIHQNIAEYGGGGIDNDSNATIIDSTISENKAEYGGGISSDGTADIDNSTISGNKAKYGGGIDITGWDGFATITNSTISGNTVTEQGGGINKYTVYGLVTVTNSTITDNSAPSGGGIQANGPRAQITVASSIVADNVDNNDVNGGGIISEGNNLIGNGNGAPAFINLFNGDLVGTANEPVDPQLSKLQDNGGDTFTHALLPESIAINTGSNPEELTTDQRGAGFERILFGAPDIGAFEAYSDSTYDLPLLPPEPLNRTVTTLDDEDDGDLGADDISLREALLASNPGDTIIFDPDLNGGTITLSLGELVVEKSLTIRGLGADKLTIDADNNSRVVNVDNDSSTRIDVTIEGVTITGGKAIKQGGGGINNHEHLIVNKSIITGNSADYGGAGILTNNYATTTVNNSTISGNSSGGGGGGVSNYSATTTLNNSTISGNSAGSDGGGISSVSFYGGTTTLNNSTISGNSAGSDGGGVFGFDSQLNIYNSTITDNSADGEGSGVYNSFGTIASTIIAGNANDDDIAYNGTSDGNNLIGNRGDSRAFNNGINEDLVGTANNPIAPGLEELQDNGGLTFTHALLPDSLAINAGSNPNKLTTDQRGAGYDRVLFDAIDIGAFEADTDSIYEPRVLSSAPVVTILDDEDDGDLSAGDVSLREAILYSESGDTISFDSDLSGGTITLTLGELIIAKDLNIKGLGADKLTIDANQNSRVLRVDDNKQDVPYSGEFYDPINVTLDGLTITGGFTNHSSGLSFNARFGGGIFNQENLTITNSIIANNVSEGGGGGIYNQGIIEIDSSIIANNSAKSDPQGNSNGGGISNSDRSDDGSVTMKISNSTISGNTTQGNGGGISNSGSYYDDFSQTIITNSTISGNSAQGNGGGVSSFARYTKIQNSTITNNSASSSGSGIDHGQTYDANRSGSTILNSTIVAGNVGERDLNGSFVLSNGNNLIGNGDNSEFTDGVDRDLVGTVDNPLDPELGVLKDNGGFTLTHALLPHSAAIETGSNPEELATDQRGLERSVEQTDIGAFEVQSDSPVSEYEIINGSTGDDILTGTNLKNILSGNAGNDTLEGGPQFDRLDGGDGDDILVGNGDIDVLTGDGGSDLFYLEDIEGLDWIRDFELHSDSIGLADNITYKDLENTGRVNSFINYEGREFAVVLGVSPDKLTQDHFVEL